MNNKVIVLLNIITIFSFAQRVDSIVRVGACATPGAADGVFTQGQYTFIADRSGVTSVDIAIERRINMLTNSLPYELFEWERI